MQNCWIYDVAGSRVYGSKEFMIRNLESRVTAMLNSKNEFELHQNAVAAWHWALALEEISEGSTHE